MEELDSSEVVLISGMGPAGLAAACEAILANKKVVIVTNRPENEQIRPQRVTLTQSRIRYLQNLLLRMGSPPFHLSPEDDDFMNQLDYGNTFAIKKIEKFLLRRIQEYRERRYPVEIIDNAKLEKVSLTSGTATVGSRTFRVTEIIGADGVGRHAVKVYNANLDLTDDHRKITFEADEHQPHEWHVSAYVTITTADGSPVSTHLPEEIFVGTENGLHYGLACKPGILNNTIKCNITAELPAGLSSSSDKKVIMAHLQSLVDIAFGCRTVVKMAESKNSESKSTKDKAKLLVFKLKLDQANFAIMRYAGVRLILMGDAHRSPNYQIGHGLNDALAQAEMLGQLYGGEIGEYEYDQACKKCGEVAQKETLANENQSEKFVEQLNYGIALMLNAHIAPKEYIENLRYYFYACMPHVEKREISLFSMLNYFDEEGRTFLHRAVDEENVDVLNTFLKLNYFFQPMSQGKESRDLLDYAVFRGRRVSIHGIIAGLNDYTFFGEGTDLLERALACDIDTFNTVILSVLSTNKRFYPRLLAESLVKFIMKDPEIFFVIEHIHSIVNLGQYIHSWDDIEESGSVELKKALAGVVSREENISLFDICTHARDYALSLKQTSLAESCGDLGLFLSVDESAETVSCVSRNLDVPPEGNRF